MAIFDVPAAELIEAMAADFKKQVKQPVWIEFVKSGPHRERAPHRRDWFYLRMASILYRVYKDGPVGTNRLRTYYGGRKARGPKPHRFKRASGKVIRLSLQELDKLGYLKKAKRGRVVSSKGEGYLNLKSKEIKKILGEKKAQQANLLGAHVPSEEKKEQQASVPKALHPGEKRAHEAVKAEVKGVEKAKGKEIAEKATGEKK